MGGAFASLREFGAVDEERELSEVGALSYSCVKKAKIA